VPDVRIPDVGQIAWCRHSKPGDGSGPRPNLALLVAAAVDDQ